MSACSKGNINNNNGNTSNSNNNNNNLHWGYTHNTCQPNEWPRYYPTGSHQSPVNILVSEALVRSTCCLGRHLPMSPPASPEGSAEMRVLADEVAAKCNTRCSKSRSKGAMTTMTPMTSIMTPPMTPTTGEASAKPAAATAKRRSHLDSAGEEDQQRSPSSSASPSGSSSSGASSAAAATASPLGPNANDAEGANDDAADERGQSDSNAIEEEEEEEENWEENDCDYDRQGAHAKTLEKRRSLGDNTLWLANWEESGRRQQQLQQQLQLSRQNKQRSIDRFGNCNGESNSNCNGTASGQDAAASGRTFGHTQNTRHCVSNKKLFLGYPRYLSTVQLCNTGHNWQVNLAPELARHTLLAGPPFGNREYRLAQFHCHWGKSCDQGSEHQINGRSFAAEIHFVHWNCTDFDSIAEASKHKHGLAVLAVFAQALEGDQNRNRHLEKIIAGLKSVAQKPGSSVNVNARLDLKKLFPANRWVYANYQGSLTTPPLSEVVDWVVFLNPIQCSTSQIEQFRKLKSSSTKSPSDGAYLTDNCRPIQPINERVVSIWSHHQHHE